ncbi:alkaline phosphatase family protein [Luteolibacter ambystomatis]|uniref:Alkaline phosphatase family protein n=1 Tax=Luteolibacter ambystomatis TaxID=2824561 RepID=A0A975PGW6_9BACT|nr:alkaline phosphatase family protein [Luteolibacter ambystomatis]QUE53153.1 alkaline phosphatase family protein [Luteolibacter ambystomatis]
MNRMIRRLFVAVLAIAGSPFANAEAARAEHVFIISFDQASPAGIEKAEMPLFKKMAAEGAHTWEAYTIVPSLTLPSHTSMLTGVGIQKHQVDWNNYQPEKGVVKVPTIFALAKQKGLGTAMFVAKEKFQHLNQPGTVDTFVYPKDDETCGSVARRFAEEVVKSKPALCFIHFGDPDVKGHEFGIYSPEKMQAYTDTDKALKVIRDAVDKAGLTASSVFILTADHGCHDIKDKNGITRGTHGDSSPDDVTIPWVAWGKGVKPGATITAPVVQYDTAATALWLLGVPVPEGFWGRPVTSAFGN